MGKVFDMGKNLHEHEPPEIVPLEMSLDLHELWEGCRSLGEVCTLDEIMARLDRARDGLDEALMAHERARQPSQ